VARCRCGHQASREANDNGIDGSIQPDEKPGDLRVTTAVHGDTTDGQDVGDLTRL
jgi:hypothetical protein